MDRRIENEPGVRAPVVETPRPERVARSSAAAAPLGLGGLALLIGSVMAWASDATTGGAETGDVSGTTITDGRLTLGIGVALVIMALYMASTKRLGHWFDADLLGLTLGAIATAVAVAVFTELPEGSSAEPGLYVTIAGGLIAALGSLAALMLSRRADDLTEDRTRTAQDRTLPA